MCKAGIQINPFACEYAIITPCVEEIFLFSPNGVDSLVESQLTIDERAYFRS
jgi:hypothetical protein